MGKTPSLDELWNLTSQSGSPFDPDSISDLPEPARRYLGHAIAPGTPAAKAVRLNMHGEIKLNRWFPFRAEQVIRWDRGFIWQASTRVFGIPIRGFDRIIDGNGEMRWKLLGLFPFLKASGEDISRSAAGRLGVETVWLPSALCGEDADWAAIDSSSACALLQVADWKIEVKITLNNVGGLKAVKLRRWGNPSGGEFRELDFGGIVETEETFQGYTIPTQLRVGWHFGTDRFEPEGEFFRCRIDHAEFR